MDLEQDLLRKLDPFLTRSEPDPGNTARSLAPIE